MEQYQYQQYPEQMQQVQVASDEFQYGPRKMSFFTLVLKTMAGLVGGIAGSLVLLIIFLLSSSILQPVLGQTAETEVAQGDVSIVFLVVIIAMVFATSVVSSMVSTLLLSFTERDRYTKISTALGQVFIVNIVIFLFVLPIYLTTSTTRLELTAFAVALQIIMSATAGSLILELIHDRKYALLAVYNTILAILLGSGVNFLIYFSLKSATLLLFVAIPIIWTLIGFFHGALTMFYYWIFQTWGSDFLVYSASFGRDYGVQEKDEEEEDEQLPTRPDSNGADFLK